MESMYGTGAAERAAPPPRPVSQWVPSAVLAKRAQVPCLSPCSAWAIPTTHHHLPIHQPGENLY